MENVTDSLFRLDSGGIATCRRDNLRPEMPSTHLDDRPRLAGTKGVIEYQDSTRSCWLRGSQPITIAT